MSLIFCQHCDQYIDTDFDTDHFDVEQSFECIFEKEFIKNNKISKLYENK